MFVRLSVIFSVTKRSRNPAPVMRYRMVETACPAQYRKNITKQVNDSPETAVRRVSAPEILHCL